MTAFRVRLFCILALAALPFTARAQGVYVGAGPSLPVGNDGTTSYSSGFQAQGGFALSPILLPVGFRFGGFLDTFGTTLNGKEGDNFRMVGGNADLVVSLSGAPLVGPYLVGGVDAARLGVGGSAAGVNKVGWHAGGGVHFGLAGIGLFAEATYHYFPGNDGFKFVPLVVGITM